MPHLFASPRLTLARAEHHIGELSRSINEFRHANPGTYVVEPDLESQHDIHKIRFGHKPSEDWPCILFDAANNLRAALDQAGYASAIAAQSVSLKHIKFPFAKDCAHWANAAGSCKDLPTEIRDIFMATDAYKGGPNLLWAMNELCNTQKHFRLMPLALGNMVLTVSPAPNAVIRRAIWNPENLELIFLEVQSGHETQYNTHFSYNIAVEGIETLEGKDILHAAQGMRNTVNGILIATEAECRRMKWIA